MVEKFSWKQSNKSSLRPHNSAMILEVKLKTLWIVRDRTYRGALNQKRKYWHLSLGGFDYCGVVTYFFLLQKNKK